MATIVAKEPVTPGLSSASEPDQAPAIGERSLTIWMWATGLVVLTAICYANSLRAPYLFDDKYFFDRDVTYQSVEKALASSAPRRFGVLTFALDYRLHGRSRAGCHLVNIAIHATAGLLLFGLVRQTLRVRGIPGASAERNNALAALVAALWLVHPLQTSAVTYVIQRFESLMGMLFLLALYGVARGTTARRKWPWYLLTLVAAWLGVQTKEVMAMLPIVAIAYDRIFLSASWRDLLKRRGWLHFSFAMCSMWLIYEIRWAFDLSQKGSAGMGTPGVTPWEYLRSQGGVLLHYLRLSFWPDHLCLDYRWPIAQTAWEIYVPGTIIMTLVTITGWALWKKPQLGFLGLAFFAILAPTSSVMPIMDLAFEHRMYLPLAAVIVLVVFGMEDMIRRLEAISPGARWTAVCVTSVAIVLLSARTIARNLDYQDAIRMWRSVVLARPDNSRAYANLGFALLDQGLVNEAERHFLRAVELKPQAFGSLLGMGRLRFRQERDDEAREYFQAIRQKSSSRVIACEYLARIEERRGNWSQAIAYCREGIADDPNCETIRLLLARACLKIGETKEAVTVLRDAIAFNRHSHEAKSLLAQILATTDDLAVRNGPEALRIARELATSSRTTAASLDTLAAAYAAVGRFDEAQTAAENALQLPADSAARLRIRERLKGYRHSKPIFLKCGDKHHGDEVAGGMSE